MLYLLIKYVASWLCVALWFKMVFKCTVFIYILIQCLQVILGALRYAILVKLLDDLLLLLSFSLDFIIWIQVLQLDIIIFFTSCFLNPFFFRCCLICILSLIRPTIIIWLIFSVTESVTFLLWLNILITLLNQQFEFAESGQRSLGFFRSSNLCQFMRVS